MSDNIEKGSKDGKQAKIIIDKNGVKRIVYINGDFLNLVKKYKRFYADENENITHPIGNKKVSARDYISKYKDQIQYVIEKDKANPINVNLRDKDNVLWHVKNNKRSGQVKKWNEIPEHRRVVKEIKHNDPLKLAVEHMAVELINKQMKQGYQHKVVDGNLEFTKVDELGEELKKIYAFDYDSGDFVLQYNEVEKSIEIIINALNNNRLDYDKIEKAHKYIKKEPDGKGGWNYIYNENKLGNKTKSEEDFNIFIKKIKDYANEVIEGRKHIKYLSPEEEQGSIEGGRINVEATVFFRASQKSDPKLHGRNFERVEQLKNLEKFAKKNGYWVKDYSKIYKPEDKLEEATESEVFYDKDGFVVKINNFTQHEEIAELFDRIAVQNYLFPDTGYKLIGFTNRDGHINAIMTQPFIKMKLDKNGKVVRPTKEQLSLEMDKMGFEDVGGNMFVNSNYIVEDLHSKNICFSEEGKIMFIDPVIRLNLKDEGYDGDRKISNINLEDNIEKSETQMDYGTGKRQEQIEVHSKTGKTFIRKQVVGKKEEQKQIEPKKYTEDELKQHARKAAQTDLERHIKEGSDENMRKVAHEELDRRSKEEHIQEEKEQPLDKKSKVDTTSDKKEASVSKENKHLEKFRTLSDENIKFYLDAPYPEVKEAAKMVADERGLSVVSKEDYIKSFEDFDLSDDFDKKQEEHHAKFKLSILKDKTEEQRQKIFDEEESSLQNLEELKKKAKEQIIKAKSFYEDDSKIIKGLLSLPSNKDLSVALNLYKSFDFDLIRKYLSTGNVDSEKYKSILDKRVDLISNFIQENKIKNNITLYRMVSDSRSNPFFSKLKEGDIYEDKSFSSTSLRKLQFFGDFKIKILAKKGSNVANIDNPGELEYLVDKNSKFRVIEKHKDGLGITVELL